MKEMSTKPKPEEHRIEERRVDSLKPHPMQHDLFGDLNDAEIQQLADDMDRDGLHVPVEILLNGTIICGHQRLAAAKLLGWTHIRCWIRDDLEEQGEDAIKARLVEDNLLRRQLSKLGVARCYQQLKRLGRGHRVGDGKGGDRRDQLAKPFGMTGRSLDRYLEMLKAPRRVQQAFEEQQLTQRQVLAVIKLDADLQQEIAERIAEGQKPAAVVKEYSVSKIQAKASSTALSLFVAASQRLQHNFDGGIEDMVEQLNTDNRNALRGARKMITRLIGPPKPNGQKGHPVKNKNKRNEGTK